MGFSTPGSLRALPFLSLSLSRLIGACVARNAQCCPGVWCVLFLETSQRTKKQHCPFIKTIKMSLASPFSQCVVKVCPINKHNTSTGGRRNSFSFRSRRWLVGGEASTANGTRQGFNFYHCSLSGVSRLCHF